ncbi:DUF1028 domain-containing protein [Aeromonas lacus]
MMSNGLNRVAQALIISLFPIAANATYSIIAVDTSHHRMGVALGSCLASNGQTVPMTLLDKTNMIVPAHGIFQHQGLLYRNEAVLAKANRLLNEGKDASSVITALKNDASIKLPEQRQYAAIAKDGIVTSSDFYNGSKLSSVAESVTGSVGSISYVISGNRLKSGTLTFLENAFTSSEGGVETRLMATFAAMADEKTVGDAGCASYTAGTTNAYIKVINSDNVRNNYITQSNFEFVSRDLTADAVKNLKPFYDKYRTSSDYINDVKLTDAQSFDSAHYAAANESVYFTIPPEYNAGSVKNAPDTISPTPTRGYSIVEALAYHPSSQFTVPVKIRVSNVDRSGNAYTMNSAVSGKLRLSFYHGDNLIVPTGDYHVGLNVIATNNGKQRRIFIPLTLSVNNEVITLAGKVSGTFAAGAADWNATYNKADQICTQSRQLDSRVTETFGFLKFKALLSNRTDVVSSGVIYRRGGPWRDALTTIINTNASSSGHELVFNSSQTGTVTPWGDRAWWGTADHRWDCGKWDENYSGWVGANMDPGANGIQTIDREWCTNNNYLVCVSTGEDAMEQ